MGIKSSGTLRLSEINVELGNGATTPASINSSQFRTLAGKSTGPIRFSDFYGKSNGLGPVNNYNGWTPLYYIDGSGVDTPNIRKIIYHNGKWFAISSDVRIWVSTDKVNWTVHAQFATVKGSATSLYDICTDGTTIMACANAGHIWRSDDDGDTWQKVGTNIAVIAGTPTIRTIDIIAGRIWISWAGRIAYSDDMGETFTLDEGWKAIGTIPSIDAVFSFKDMVIAVSVDSLWTTSNNGSTWVKHNSFTSSGVRAEVGVGSNTVAIVAGDGMAAYSTDGVTWVLADNLTALLGEGSQSAWCVETDGINIIVGGQWPQAVHTQNGVDWAFLPTPSVSRYSAIGVSPDGWMMSTAIGQLTFSNGTI